ncbi:ADP compounds hydrolase NudE [Marinobacterium zhoushanense]|uniref:ADP compounds hydrolase NudE n=1 Tax=Marinobacterium zhoushanense TaxID=1679163 RepID=A0ABQ1KTE0_9GAMM|nr:ADP compounds hydrolase NudE [Marinobacterium zhoushanense]GGC09499.1 ADP compounds hydrolase NudE [Marinobacterium zhoushanense]
MPTKPEILKVTPVSESRLFQVEALDLRFSNGVERRFERLALRGHGAVMVVALDADNNIQLIREYAAGLHDYVLTLPKGLIDAGETPLEAANRELQEEVGFGARQMVLLKNLSSAPNYMGHSMNVILARDLYPSKLEGDEPEPLERVPWPFDNIEELIVRDDFSEGRAIAALYLARHWLSQESETADA